MMSKKEKGYWIAGGVAFLIVLGYVVNLYINLPN